MRHFIFFTPTLPPCREGNLKPLLSASIRRQNASRIFFFFLCFWVAFGSYFALMGYNSSWPSLNSPFAYVSNAHALFSVDFTQFEMNVTKNVSQGVICTWRTQRVGASFLTATKLRLSDAAGVVICSGGTKICVTAQETSIHAFLMTTAPWKLDFTNNPRII